MNHLARWVVVVVLLLPLLLLPMTWQPPKVGFYHSVIILMETHYGTTTLTKWEWYEQTP